MARPLYPALGERCGSAKLTPSAVRTIRALSGSVSIRALASRLGVSHTTVQKAASRQTWRHV